MNSDKIIRCENCRFYEVRVPKSYGKCLRYPPQVTEDLGHKEFSFPKVLSTWWCGEFVQK